VRPVRATVVAAALFAAACGSSSPSAPAKPLPVVQVSITPSPVSATVVSFGANAIIFRVQGTATFQETAGTAGHLTRVFGVVAQASGTLVAGTLVTDIQLDALGSVSAVYSQDVELDNIANAVWRLSASGADELGRSFTTQIGEVPITPPSGTSDVEPIQIHHLRPRGDEITREFPLRIFARIDLRERAELGVRAEDEIDAAAGPPPLPRLAIDAFERFARA
jgi:hypothetical protein